MKDYLELFDESLQRVMTNTIDGKDFPERFYEILLSNSPQAAEKFEHTNMEVQRLLLRQAISFMLNFTTTFKSTSHLKYIAQRHSHSQMDIQPELYDEWLASFLKAVGEYDVQFNQDIELAWIVVLAPGIAYMKYHYDRN